MEVGCRPPSFSILPKDPSKGPCTAASHIGTLLLPDHCSFEEEMMLSKPLPLPVVDRRTGEMISEFMDDSSATYESLPRRSVMQWLGSSPTWDWLVAAYQSTPLSARKIEPFIRKHHIDMTEFEPGPFKTYAQFFDRKFLPGKRQFPDTPKDMGAFAEARYLGWEKLEPGMEFPIKGHSLTP